MGFRRFAQKIKHLVPIATGAMEVETTTRGTPAKVKGHKREKVKKAFRRMLYKLESFSKMLAREKRAKMKTVARSVAQRASLSLIIEKCTNRPRYSLETLLQPGALSDPKKFEAYLKLADHLCKAGDRSSLDVSSLKESEENKQLAEIWKAKDEVVNRNNANRETGLLHSESAELPYATFGFSVPTRKPKEHPAHKRTKAPKCVKVELSAVPKLLAAKEYTNLFGSITYTPFLGRIPESTTTLKPRMAGEHEFSPLRARSSRKYPKKSILKNMTKPGETDGITLDRLHEMKEIAPSMRCFREIDVTRLGLKDHKNIARISPAAVRFDETIHFAEYRVNDAPFEVATYGEPLTVDRSCLKSDNLFQSPVQKETAVSAVEYQLLIKEEIHELKAAVNISKSLNAGEYENAYADVSLRLNKLFCHVNDTMNKPNAIEMMAVYHEYSDVAKRIAEHTSLARGVGGELEIVHQKIVGGGPFSEIEASLSRCKRFVADIDDSITSIKLTATKMKEELRSRSASINLGICNCLKMRKKILKIYQQFFKNHPRSDVSSYDVHVNLGKAAYDYNCRHQIGFGLNSFGNIQLEDLERLDSGVDVLDAIYSNIKENTIKLSVLFASRST